jgi:hypothetical protein
MGVIPDKFAIMTVDPGKTTGMATGIFRTDKGDDMLKSVIGRAVKKKQISSWQETGPSEDQAWAIALHWTNFRYKCMMLGIPVPDIHLVVENFFLRELQAQLESVQVIYGLKTLLKFSGANTHIIRISLAPDVIAGCELDDFGIVKRVAPILKKYKLVGKSKRDVFELALQKGWIATARIPWPYGEPEMQQPSDGKQIKNDRLKTLGIYVAGSEHQRDARRHIVHKVNRILEGR